MILAEDIYSTFVKGHLYGKAGEPVQLISDRDTVLIVEGKSGRFPVLKSKVINK